MFQLQGDHTTQPPQDTYSSVLERRLLLIVKPRVQEEQSGLRPGRGAVDQIFTLADLLRGSREFGHTVYMCIVDLEKAYDSVPREILWGMLREYGVPFYELSSP